MSKMPKQAIEIHTRGIHISQTNKCEDLHCAYRISSKKTTAWCQQVNYSFWTIHSAFKKIWKKFTAWVLLLTFLCFLPSTQLLKNKQKNPTCHYPEEIPERQWQGWFSKLPKAFCIERKMSFMKPTDCQMKPLYRDIRRERSLVSLWLHHYSGLRDQWSVWDNTFLPSSVRWHYKKYC